MNLVKEKYLKGHQKPNRILEDFRPTDRLSYRIKTTAIHGHTPENGDDDQEGKQDKESGLKSLSLP